METILNIFGYTVEIHIYKNSKISKRLLDEISEYLLSQKKLAACKTIKTNFDIGLKEAKDICDEVFVMSYPFIDSTEAIAHYSIKTKKGIVKHLKKRLSNYNTLN